MGQSAPVPSTPSYDTRDLIAWSEGNPKGMAPGCYILETHKNELTG